MGSKTLDVTSWYELQADSDSDDDHVNPHLAVPCSHDLCSHHSVGGSRSNHLQPFTSHLTGQQSKQSNVILQLLDEMDDANQKIDQYSATRKSDAVSLEEYPIDSMSNSAKGREDNGCDGVVTTAIAEVSKDFTSGNLSTGPLISEESDESHVSSDNDWRYRKGASYAKYPETAAGLSDSDWNPYITESDTNTSPRLAGDLRPISFSSNTDSRINSLASSFNPPFCSTKSGSASKLSKTSPQLTNLTTAQDSSLFVCDNKERPEANIRSPKPDMSNSKLSEYSFEKQSQSREEAARNLKKCFERTSWPPSPDKYIGRSTLPSQTAIELLDKQHKEDNGIDRTGIEEDFRKLRNFGDYEGKSSFEIKSSLPGRGYFSESVQTALSGSKIASNQRSACSRGFQLEQDLHNHEPAANTSNDHYLCRSDVKSIEDGREKIHREFIASKDSDQSDHTSLSRESDLHTRSTTGSSTDTIIPAAKSGKDSASMQQSRLTQQVNKLLRETAYLTGSCRAKEKDVEAKAAKKSTSLDYDRLHKDLQEIQDSLNTMGQPVSSPCVITVPLNRSDSDEGDIVPSTTTTPEKGRRLLWDCGADLVYRGGYVDSPEGMMTDMISKSSPVDIRFGKHDKINYTSDGEETRTSSMDHAEEEEHHEETNVKLTNQLGQPVSTTGSGIELEELLSTFRTQTQAVKDRYQAVRSQGMVDKVMSILISTNPDQQAEDILSQISAEEREVSLHMAGLASKLDTGHLGSSPHSFFTWTKSNDPVRRCLDMSSVDDSDDSTHIQESNPRLKAMFSATSMAQSLISAQMKKMAERTFNHSLELRSPQWQEVQCYPVYSSQHDKPQHQQLQQPLQKKQQQKQTGLKEAWTEKRKTSEDQKCPGDLTAQKFESFMTESKAKSHGAEGSPSSVSSPAESDKSSEMYRGKYRPYRPAGSHDVYYTESDTASVVESVTTVESTHTGSDDAVAPYFPSSALGSRPIGEGGVPGIYAKHNRPAGTTMEPHLPTIQERSTPDSVHHGSSDLSDKGTYGGSDSGLKGLGSRIPVPVEGQGGLWHNSLQPRPALGSDAGGISSIVARQQARMEVIMSEKDSSRKVPASETSHKEILGKSKGEQIEEKVEKTAALQAHGPTSNDSGQRSRIPVRGPPSNYQAGLDSKLLDPPQFNLEMLARTKQNTNANRQPSYIETSGRLCEGQPSASQHVGASTSEEAHLLQAVDAQVGAEIREAKQKGASAEKSDKGFVKPFHQEQQGIGRHEVITPCSDEDQFKMSTENRNVGLSKPISSSWSGEEDMWTKRIEQHRRWQEGDPALPGDSKTEESVGNKQQKEELFFQQDQKAQEAAQALVRKDAKMDLKAEKSQRARETQIAAEAPGNLSNNRIMPTKQSSGVAGQIMQRKDEIDEAILDKRTEKAELERQHLEVQIAKERELSRTIQVARQEEMLEAQARRQQVLAAAEARREAGLQQEKELRRQREGEEATEQVQRKAGETKFRRQEEMRREMGIRRERELQKKTASKREADQVEIKNVDCHREDTLHREAAVHRAVELKRVAAQVSEEELRREAELSIETAQQQQKSSQDAERQREAEEAIARAGGNTHNMDSVSLQEADIEQTEKVQEQLDRERSDSVDHQPLSRRVQILHEALQQETAYQRPDLHILWERFIAGSNNAYDNDSSLGSEKVSMLADLLRDPTQHLVHTFLTQRQKQQHEDRKKATACRQAVHIQQEENHFTKEEELAMQERQLHHQKAKQQQQRLSSEEESNGSYGEILQQRERDRLKRREVRTQRKKLGKSLSPPPSISKPKITSGITRLEVGQGDTLETLYSIPEDISYNATPHKSRSPHRIHSKQRHADVIDPHMDKLRHRIQQQRKKISKERVKEVYREQKLDKLKALLKAKQSGLLNDHSIAAHLASISGTTTGSSDDTLTVHSQASACSEHTTTAKDSSAEMQRTKLANSIPQAHFCQREKMAVHGMDLSMELEFTPLQEDSSQTDDSYPDEQDFGGRKEAIQSSKHTISSYQPSKHGGRCIKRHQLYSPYQRQEIFQSEGVTKKTKQSRFERSKPFLKDVSTMYPSPRPHTLTQHSSWKISRSVQTLETSPKSCKNQHRSGSLSPVYKDRRVCSVPLMTSKGHLQFRDRDIYCQTEKNEIKRQSGLRKIIRPSRSVSPAFDSSQVAACLSPDRNRPCSASPARPDRHRHQSPSSSRQRSLSPLELRQKAERKSRSPLRDHHNASPISRHQENFIPPRRVKRYDLDGENQVLSTKQQFARSTVPSALSWFIPLKEEHPWRQPSEERWTVRASQEDRHPTILSNQQWRELARSDLEDCEGRRGLKGSLEGDTARMYLHTVTKEAEQELGLQYDKFDHKPLCRMSLQEALMNRRPDFVSSLRQRQKRVKLAAEHRQLQAMVLAEQDRIFADQRQKNTNPNAHPYSENLYNPRRRVFSKHEMKEMTEKVYKHLPEVKRKETDKRRREEYSLNRLRAKIFNKRVQRKVLDRKYK